jgi:AcrR family transcriptional regulator
MARSQSPDYGERRGAMLDSAAELFARAGFHGTSIADLATAWGISKSLLYHYFDSKEAILFEVMREHMHDLNAMAEQCARRGDPEERLRDLTRGFMSLYSGAAARHKVLLNDLDKLPAGLRAEITGDERKLMGLVRATLCELHPQLLQDPARATALTMLYFGMINWTHSWYDPSGPLPPPDLADMVARLVAQGLEGAANPDRASR